MSARADAHNYLTTIEEMEEGELDIDFRLLAILFIGFVDEWADIPLADRLDLYTRFRIWTGEGE